MVMLVLVLVLALEVVTMLLVLVEERVNSGRQVRRRCGGAVRIPTSTVRSLDIVREKR